MSLIGIKRWILNKQPLKVDTFSGDRLDKRFGRIGLVALVDTINEIETIMSFYNELVDNNEEVSCMLFTNKRDLQHEFLLTKSNISWLGKPFGTQVESFLDYDYDQIWFATYAFNIPMQYIIRNSKSPLKLGLFAKETYNYCHLFVDIIDKDIGAIIRALKQIMLKINTDG
jgi:hypothetical protein